MTDDILARSRRRCLRAPKLDPPGRVNIGERNFAAARAALAQDRNEILATDACGEDGRSFDFELEKGRGRIRRRGMDRVEI